MSDINNSLPGDSEQFQILQPENSLLSAQSSDEVFICLNENQPQTQQEEMTVGILIEEETFIVLERKESTSNFGPNDWQELIQRKQKEIAAEVAQERRSEDRLRLTRRQRDAVLAIGSDDSDGRKRLWEIANYSQGIQKEFIAREMEAQQSRQEILTIISYQLTEFELKSLQCNAKKIHKVVKTLSEQREDNPDAMRLWLHQKEIMQWIYDALMRYALDDQQVRYSKGIEYVCLGIVVAYPHLDLPKYSQLLHHFMHRHAFRELYQEGSPRFFRELQSMRQALREDAPQLYHRLEESDGDFKNLLVTYFRSCLIYKVSSTQLIRKVFELLFVEGAPGLKNILLRILTVHAPYFLKQNNFLQHICSQIIVAYFDQKDPQKIHCKFQQLFLI